MRPCPQVASVEDLVLETLTPARARALRSHLESCTTCRREEQELRAERALFTHREPLVAPPPPAVAVALRARLTEEARDTTSARARPSREANRFGRARRGATRLLRGAMRSATPLVHHASLPLAATALLLALVVFARLGGAPTLPSADVDRPSEGADRPSEPPASDEAARARPGSDEAAGAEPASGYGASTVHRASTADDSLACASGGAPAEIVTAPISLPVAMSTPNAASVSPRPAQAAHATGPACGGGMASTATFEPTATCSAW
jgi:hypothetical protein